MWRQISSKLAGLMAKGQWRLADHGDSVEIDYWPLFGELFPAYEIYWRNYAVPLTKRDGTDYSIQFKSDKELALLKPPRSKGDLDMAKLNYATFWHLCAVYRLRHDAFQFEMELDTFTHCITRLASARDTAAAFAGIATGLSPDPKKARVAWWTANPNKRMQQLGAYRNHLVHGAPFMRLNDGLGSLFPRIGREERYHDDWRGRVRRSDFARPELIVDAAWTWCLRYAERTWRSVLKVIDTPSAYPPPTAAVDFMVELRTGAGSGVTSTASYAINPPTWQVDPFWSVPVSGSAKQGQRTPKT